MVGLAVPAAVAACRVTLPEEASSGATPQSLAQVASLRSPEGLSPAAMRRSAAVSGRGPPVRRVRAPPCRPSGLSGHRGACPPLSATALRPRVPRALLVAMRTGSASECTRRTATPSECATREAPQSVPQFVGGGVDELTDLVDGLGSRLMALRRATMRARIASTLPSRVLATPKARPHSAARTLLCHRVIRLTLPGPASNGWAGRLRRRRGPLDAGCMGRAGPRRSPAPSTPTRPIFPKAHIQALSNL